MKNRLAALTALPIFLVALSVANVDTADAQFLVPLMDLPKSMAILHPDTMKFPVSTMTAAKSEIALARDSLVILVKSSKEEVDELKAKIGSLQSRLSQKIDSLTALPTLTCCWSRVWT